MVTLSGILSGEILRVIDANLNRLGEGLRVLEDIARLVLDDAILTEKLKIIRHELLEVDLELSGQLVAARDSEGDVGADLEVPGQEKERELPQLIVADSRRVQQALRVLEEMSKIATIELDPEKFKHARFKFYTIEKELLSRLKRQTDQSMRK